MRVFLTGGTGLIGRRLSRFLIARGDTPVILSRQADKARLNPALRGAEIVQGDPGTHGSWESAVDGCDAAINLVGHNVFANRWSPEIKAKIRDSRVVGTQNLVEAIARAARRPRTLVQGSAIGYYGPTQDQELTEDSPSGSDFMAEVCREWESAARPAETLGLRLPIIRTGVVLAKGEGALGVMTPLFKWVPGGAAPVGSGKNGLKPGRGQQWMSWIHLDDIAGLFLMALDHPEAKGPMNGTSPNPVRNYEFSKELARALGRRWVFLPIGPPDSMLNLILGEVAQIVTTGQKVLPRKAERLGYQFRYPVLAEALANLFGPTAETTKAKPEVAATRD
ncbi:MAG: hypothetical protein JWN86_1714 [Planctomycetota bacterium]|nr:hypothetical protein [Planctomycetota bacterium]